MENLENLDLNNLTLKQKVSSNDLMICLDKDKKGFRTPESQFAKSEDLGNLVTNNSTSWKDADMLNGWTGTIKYRFNKIGNLEIGGNIVHTNASSQNSRFCKLKDEDIAKASNIYIIDQAGFACQMFRASNQLCSRMMFYPDGQFSVHISETQNAQISVYFQGTFFAK